MSDKLKLPNTPPQTDKTLREVKHEPAVLSITADAPRVRVKPKGQNITISPPAANMGVKSK